MYTMKNKELQKKVNKYYNTVEAHVEYIRSVNTVQSELFELDPAIYPAKFLLSQLKNPKMDLRLIDTTWINNPKSATFLSFDNYLNSNQNLNNVYRRIVFKRILTAADALLVDIDKELESRK